MHCVQPVTAMLPVCYQLVLLPKSNYLRGQSIVREITQVSVRGLSLFSRLGYKRFYAANSSFIMRSENRDGELPTRRRRLWEQHAPKN